MNNRQTSLTPSGIIWIFTYTILLGLIITAVLLTFSAADSAIIKIVAAIIGFVVGCFIVSRIGRKIKHSQRD